MRPPEVTVMNGELRRVLCIAGSLRKHSWNRRLLVAAGRLAPADLALEVYGHLSELPMFNEDLEFDPPPEVRQLRAEVRAARGLLLATPEYNHSFPAVLKNALDWLSRGDPSSLHGKPVALIGATVGSWGTRLAQAALRQTLLATGARLMAEPMLFVARASSCFDADGVLSDPAIAESLAEVLRAFSCWIGPVSSAGQLRAA
jgi:chromate reductase, NAD(P)H dehydrogenase (quinone)